MGRVKDYYWDEINARAAREDGEEPDELEMAEAFHELEGERLKAARTARLKEEENVKPV